jgi:DNA repair protein RadC
MKITIKNPQLKVAEVQLIYKTKVNPNDRAKIASSNDAYQILLNFWNKDTIEYYEEFKIITLNRANRVLGIITISQGGVNGTVTDAKLIFQMAIRTNASGIILAHNHPSGQLIPSDADKAITQKIQAGGKLLDINLLDHIILAPHVGYFSFADEGII